MKTAHISDNTILYVNGISKSFDGFKALNSLSLTLEKGQMRAIIGPNGAGKTTMMDVITGKLRPDSGEVIFGENIDLTQYDEAEIANLGIGRKFQKPTVIESLSLLENLELALQGSRGVLQALFHRLSGEQKSRIDEVLELIALPDRRHELSGALSHGQKQWLEIGMLLVQNPQLLLVDEPAAGMTDSETEATAELLKEITGDHSVVVVEHDMDFIKALDTTVTVLHEGSTLTEGRLEDIQNDQRVIEVYLGR